MIDDRKHQDKTKRDEELNDSIPLREILKQRKAHRIMCDMVENSKSFKALKCQHILETYPQTLATKCLSKIAETVFIYDAESVKAIFTHSPPVWIEQFSLLVIYFDNSQYVTFPAEVCRYAERLFLSAENLDELFKEQFSDENKENKSYEVDNWEDIQDWGLESIIEQHQGTLLSLKDLQIFGEISLESISMLGNNCSNLEKLSLHNFILQGTGEPTADCCQVLQHFSAGFESLEELEFSFCSWLIVDAFEIWMNKLKTFRENNSPNLRKLQIIRVVGQRFWVARDLLQSTVEDDRPLSSPLVYPDSISRRWQECVSSFYGSCGITILFYDEAFR